MITVVPPPIVGARRTAFSTWPAAMSAAIRRNYQPMRHVITTSSRSRGSVRVRIRCNYQRNYQNHPARALRWNDKAPLPDRERGFLLVGPRGFEPPTT